ncbi:MAG: L-lactate dehydrogenase [Sumerlaeia bacterium]
MTAQSTEAQNHFSRTIGRVAMIGLGAVGSTTVFALLHAKIAQEILLVDDHNRRRAEGELLDLQHTLPFSGPANIHLASLDETRHCDLVIITAGAAQSKDETRLDLMKRNVEIFRTFFPRLSQQNPNALFVIVTNPVDIMTRVALELSGLPPEQVFGTGTVLDTARFRQNLSTHLGVSSNNVHAYVIGEHGDSEVIVWSRVQIGPFTLQEYADLKGKKLSPAVKQQMDEDVRRAAYQIIERKGSTHFAIGSGTTRLIETLSNDRHQLYTVSRQISLPGIPEGVCMSIPTEMGRKGALLPIALKLSPIEEAELQKSGNILDKAYQKLTV